MNNIDPIEAYVILGSNSGETVQHIMQAFADLAELPQTRVICTSSLYNSPFLGSKDQPDVINAAVKLSTMLSAHDLLAALLAIEQLHGRVREPGTKGARTLDCDLLLYGQQIINSENLIVPHPELTNRPFVMIPLLEIAPDVVLPCGTKVADFLQQENEVTLL